jgi:hypothetical protein
VSDSEVSAHIRAMSEAGALIRMCAWCERIELDDEWVQPSRVTLTAIDVHNTVSHTICPACAVEQTGSHGV